MKQKRPEHRDTRVLNDIIPKKRTKKKSKRTATMWSNPKRTQSRHTQERIETTQTKLKMSNNIFNEETLASLKCTVDRSGFLGDSSNLIL
eukprot:3734432-Ditylum_brightwellii.AAC.1